MGRELIQHPLERADGSTIFSDGLYTAIAAVNGPVEVQRRDELPEEAAVEVNLRPLSGVGGPRERWLESVLQPLFKSILLVHMHPRTLIQITLQITKEPSIKLRRSDADISIIPTLINATFAALVDGALPLTTTLSAVLVTVDKAGQIKTAPEGKDIAQCASIHAMTFNTKSEQLLEQSSGSFELDTWDAVGSSAKRACVAAVAACSEDLTMNGDGQTEPWLRQVLHDRARNANAWRDSS
ncbi:Exosome complex component RRP46 [Fulvia fulva]|uniref:Exosome complex component RRP46 n=1 Tax=Passalora fulva TaxID=5499 RepID=A0A9Q8L8X3_PASFU|nr:Exosome complex component RRP46 [Fulvia fulva]KAK4634674.1 Exosome complex component RRP46 [Fulvia fulva]KAK4638211.1 Exosome complex component RRP46 [Fulvia fulva]UJO13012.1 Exosome complex component RRP46 [Fulvia fulva]WPV10298.1 Exosome complex component RRP46 [Fulvia fulva]WPV24753.1 Exosome complex component RRP46 [Fulvia fulva]